MTATNTQVVFLSGLSGSGKSTAVGALEDLDYYCVDNLPVQLVEQVLGLCAKANPPIERIAAVIDAREAAFLAAFPGVIGQLRDSGADVQLVFLDCSDDELVNRYRETRRVHPMSREGSVEEGIESERRLLVDVARLADSTVDTSTMNVHQLKAEIVRHVAGEARPTVVNLVSFGFRYGPPQTAELLFDVRFLTNPYFEESLRDRTGEDPEVAAYALGNPVGEELLERLRGLLAFLLPLYDQEGKAYLTIGVGCTGGHHRSVAVAVELARHLRAKDREVNVEHRDVARGTRAGGAPEVKPDEVSVRGSAKGRGEGDA